MPGFQGTWTSTPVTDLRVGDRVQWRAEVGIILSVEPVLGAVRFRMSLPARIRPAEVSLTSDYVLMAQRPESGQR